ncbi:Uncharacterised protein [Klebsiella pneumoniae]|nr:Uncharacterised protein [Klebsiella pneumoniae]
MGLSSATGWRRQWLSGRANPWLEIVPAASIFLQARYEVGAASKSAQKAEKSTGAAPGAKPNARWRSWSRADRALKRCCASR